MQSTSPGRRNSYPDEQFTLLKPLEITYSSDMTYSILSFLDASPLTLFTGAPSDSENFIAFYEDVFASFTTYLITDDDRVRFLTNRVARKIMTECSGPLWHKSQSQGSRTFNYNFWKST